MRGYAIGGVGCLLLIFAWLAELIPQLCAAKIILFAELCNNGKRCVGVFEENRGNRANGTNRSDKTNRADMSHRANMPDRAFGVYRANKTDKPYTKFGKAGDGIAG